MDQVELSDATIRKLADAFERALDRALNRANIGGEVEVHSFGDTAESQVREIVRQALEAAGR